MSIICRHVVNFMEELAPPHLCEEWDNIGLLIGSKNKKVQKILICLDITRNVVKEAIEQKADMIISHHPFLFKGIKRIIPEDPKGELIYSLIREDICVYCAHTNLDFAENGLNYTLAKTLGLKNIKNLKTYTKEKLYKIVVFVPCEYGEKVTGAMTAAGAGWLGNYSDCSFTLEGTGAFRPLEGSNPFIGDTGKLEKVSEFRVETIVREELLNRVVESMLEAHPYEEPAYDIYSLVQGGKEYGFGKEGELDKALSLDELVSRIKNSLNIKSLRVIGDRSEDIKRVGVFCGSFDGDVIPSLGKLDILVTGDIKYHTALDIAEMGLCVIDAGHFGTEKIIVNELSRLLSGKFSDLTIVPSKVEKDPIKVT
ncbi:Nif3-like dinuclear metal center hexameric protein [Pseudobacteroides cellulosolvens]|uniref:GTP cyclohydrolase 1 type 2 homolog n=1 Tax=Pseudobacteroides cellulosolvens ATCC 35603 = DSM 2933 TaxID=398512 RepID=A0A0L6JIE3_9FIRM|nr:Nif3-like dinuclear metal center hexameric protein [Pseudobacteroides cellulosolvens]KNY25468.1 NGG1p interacting factor 3 protein, NIF3 [Pseudobacteroides cellulosolvens ATCC 35603 = DSM 2933]